MTRHPVRSVAAAGLCVLALTVGIGVIGFAAPIVPEARRLDDQARSLVRIKRLRLAVDKLPVEIQNVGVRGEEIRDRWVTRLTQVGIEVTDDERDPTLRLYLSAVTESKVPKAVAFNPFLSLEQPARIDGIDNPLIVPTYLHILVGLETEDTLADSVNVTVEGMLDRFIKLRDAAIVTARNEAAAQTP